MCLASFGHRLKGARSTRLLCILPHSKEIKLARHTYPLIIESRKISAMTEFLGAGTCPSYGITHCVEEYMPFISSGPNSAFISGLSLPPMYLYGQDILAMVVRTRLTTLQARDDFDDLLAYSPWEMSNKVRLWFFSIRVYLICRERSR